jgi:hypothetical protein
MPDRQTEEFTQTGTVMTELVAKAREARAQGRSRRDFFTSTAKIAGATAMGAAGISLLQPIAARAATGQTSPSSDTVQDILNIAATAELLATTFYFQAINSPFLPSLHNVANLNYFQAALSQEYEHLEFLKQNGGTPLATQFYFPDNMFAVENVFYKTASLLEDYFISAYIAAALDFSGAYSSGITTASPTLIGVAVQIAGVESEHRALLRVAANENPPNNVIAETALLTSVQGAVAPLASFLQGGTGFHGPFNPPTLGNINEASMPYTPKSFKPQTYI